MSHVSRAEWHTAHFILRRVAGHYGHTVAELLADSRDAPLAEHRQIAMYLCRQHTDLSYPDLGMVFRRHYTTVLYSVRVTADSHSKRLKTEVQEVDDMITEALSAARGSVPA